MDSESRVALISGAVAVILAVIAALNERRKAKAAAVVDDDEPHADPQIVVEKIATQGIDGMTPGHVAAAVSVLAQSLTAVTARVNVLERRELAYQRRLAVVEHIAVYSEAPVPRPLPPWDDKPIDLV